VFAGVAAIAAWAAWELKGAAAVSEALSGDLDGWAKNPASGALLSAPPLVR
jgi:hypothetical protein